MTTDTSREAVERLAADLCARWDDPWMLLKVHEQSSATLLDLLSERDDAQTLIDSLKRGVVKADIKCDELFEQLQKALAERDAARDEAYVAMTLIAARGDNRDYWESRALKAEAECERLRLGGCARGQITTQWCAEAVDMMAQRDAARAAALEEAAVILENYVVDLNHGGRLLPARTKDRDILRGAYAAAIRALAK